MRWEDERYVRVYTRDTASWVLAPWEAKCVLPLIMRKLDRAGLLDVGLDGMVGLAAVIGVPIDVVSKGVEYWFRKETLTLHEGTLAMPNFLTAQEIPKSSTERKREQRERERELRLSVTNVTNVRDQSRKVTPCLSVPSLSKEYIPVSSEPEPLAQQPLLAIVEPPPESAEDLVWRHWLTAWRSRIDGKRTPEFTDKRRAMARSRLESYSPEDLTRAIDALWASNWHVENGQYAFDLVMRNSEQVEKFLARCDAASVTRLRTVLPAYPSGSGPKTRPGATSAEQSVSTGQVDTPVSEDAMWEAIALLEDTRIVRSQ